MNRSWGFFIAVAIFLWSTLAALSVELVHLPPFFVLGVCLTLGSLPSLLSWRTWFLHRKALVFGSVGIFSYHLLLFLSLRWAPAVEANLVNYLWPTFIVLFSSLHGFKIKLSFQQALGTFLGFLGAVLVISRGNSNFATDSTALFGYGAALSAALVWGAYSVWTSRTSPFPTVVVGGFCFFAGTFSLVVSYFTESIPVLSFPSIGFLILLGCGPLGLAFYAWDAGLRRGDPTRIGALSYLTPLFSTLFLAARLGQPLSWHVWLGGFFVIGGAALGSLGTQKWTRAKDIQNIEQNSKKAFRPARKKHTTP